MQRNGHLLLGVVDHANVAFDQRQGSVFQDLDQGFNLAWLVLSVDLGQDSDCPAKTLVNLLGLLDGDGVLDLISSRGDSQDESVLSVTNKSFC